MKTEAGIYTITNTESGKVYVGSAVRLTRRWDGHRFALRNGNHRNSHLQKAWNKHDEGAFMFQPVLYCDKEFLILWEQIAIDGLSATLGWNRLYNISRVAGSALGTKRTPEQRAKLSELHKGM